MFNLIRRISGSVLPRPDRPWRDDATSNAPQVGRKRRLSSPERDDEQSFSKRNRRDDSAAVLNADDTSRREDSPAITVPQGKETEDVKEVTKGVKKVELEEKESGSTPATSREATATPPPETQVVNESQETVEEEVDAAPEASLADGKSPVEHVVDETIPEGEVTSVPVQAVSDAVTSEAVPEDQSEVPAAEKSGSAHIAASTDAVKEKDNDSITEEEGDKEK